MSVLKYKHTILLMLLLWMTITCAWAQEEQDPWVGTWTSESFRTINTNATKESDEVVYSTYKYIIRITKEENKYYIRMKRINTDISNDVSYDDVTITSIQKNTIYIETYVTYTYNGKEIRIANQKKLVLKGGGVINYVWYNQHVQEYDTCSRMIVKEYDDTIEQSAFTCLNFFNDNW